MLYIINLWSFNKEEFEVCPHCVGSKLV